MRFGVVSMVSLIYVWNTICESLWELIRVMLYSWVVLLLDMFVQISTVFVFRVYESFICLILLYCVCVEYTYVQVLWTYINLLQAISVCTTSLNDAGQVIQLLSAKTGEMSAQIRDKLNNMYGQLSGNVHVMNQVKVTRRGVPGMPLNERNCKAMLHKVFSELKTLCECINLGKALAK